MTVEQATRKVRVSKEFMEQWTTRDAEGNRLSWRWGEPDGEGFYDPIISVDYADNLLADARARVEKLHRRPSPNLDDQTTRRDNVWNAALAAVLETLAPR